MAHTDPEVPPTLQNHWPKYMVIFFIFYLFPSLLAKILVAIGYFSSKSLTIMTMTIESFALTSIVLPIVALISIIGLGKLGYSFRFLHNIIVFPVLFTLIWFVLRKFQFGNLSILLPFQDRETFSVLIVWLPVFIGSLVSAYILKHSSSNLYTQKQRFQCFATFYICAIIPVLIAPILVKSQGGYLPSNYVGIVFLLGWTFSIPFSAAMTLVISGLGKLNYSFSLWRNILIIPLLFTFIWVLMMSLLYVERFTWFIDHPGSLVLYASPAYLSGLFTAYAVR